MSSPKHSAWDVWQPCSSIHWDLGRMIKTQCTMPSRLPVVLGDLGVISVNNGFLAVCACSSRALYTPLWRLLHPARFKPSKPAKAKRVMVLGLPLLIGGSADNGVPCLLCDRERREPSWRSDLLGWSKDARMEMRSLAFETQTGAPML